MLGQVRAQVPQGRRLESWSTRLNCYLGFITRGLSLGQVRLGQGTRPTGQAVRVMVWLGLESWSTRLNCYLGVITHGVSLGQVRLGQGQGPLGRRLEVIHNSRPIYVDHRLTLWSANINFCLIQLNIIIADCIFRLTYYLIDKTEILQLLYSWDIFCDDITNI